MSKLIFFLLIPIFCSSQEEQWWDTYRRIQKDYGHSVSVEYKAKDLRKFGANGDIDTGVEEMVWQYGGIEVLPTTNTIDTASSSDDGDNQTATIEGHTVDGSGNLTFVVQNITLDGQVKITLPTPLARATRIYNTSSSDFAGTVYVYEDGDISSGVPDTASDVHIVAGADNQSLKCATSISSIDYWIIESVTFSVLRAASAAVDFRLQVRELGGVWRTQMTIGVHSNSSPFQKELIRPLIIPPNSDVRVLATSSANNTSVSAILDGPLAIIK
jgi:hypothetical protein